MQNVISINRKIDRAAEELLAKHQDIIDAWYRNWIKREQERIAKALAVTNGERE